MIDQDRAKAVADAVALAIEEAVGIRLLLPEDSADPMLAREARECNAQLRIAIVQAIVENPL